MNNLKNFLHKEWEIISLVVLLLLLGLYFVFFVLAAEKNFDFSHAGASTAQKPVFSAESSDILLAAKEFPELQRDPFYFKIKHKLPEKEIQKKAPEPVTTKEEVKPKEKISKVEIKEEEITPIIEEKKVVYGVFRRKLNYRYSQTDNSGKITAVFTLTNDSNQAELHIASIGDKIQGIFILSINSQTLRVQDATGKHININFNETKNVRSREEVKN